MPRQIAGVVDVGVGQQDEVDVPGLHGQFHIFIQVLALLHAAVHQPLDVPNFNEGAAAGDLMGGADKCQFHK